MTLAIAIMAAIALHGAGFVAALFFFQAANDGSRAAWICVIIAAAMHAVGAAVMYQAG